MASRDNSMHPSATPFPNFPKTDRRQARGVFWKRNSFSLRYTRLDMGEPTSTAVAQALTQWALVVHLGLVMTLLAVNAVLWLGSRRETILTWVLAWAANILALVALLGDAFVSSDGVWILLYCPAKMVFTLLLVRGILMFKRDRLAMIHLSRSWAVVAGLAFCLLLLVLPVVNQLSTTFLVIGFVLTFGALFSGLRLEKNEAWFLVGAVVLSGLIYLHHGFRLIRNGGEPADILFVSSLWFIDVFGEFLIGLCCLLALGQRALGEMSRVNQTLESTQRTLRSLVDADPLTGLHNRRRLRKFLEESKTSNGTLVFLDVDDFKGINDRWGHLTGDRCLRRVADALRVVFRAEDGLFRVGGDEFLVVMPTMAPRAVHERIRRLRGELGAKGANAIPISIAAGVVELRPDLPMEEALALADTAMYSDKANTKQAR